MVVIKRLHTKIIASLIIGLTILGTYYDYEWNISYGTFLSAHFIYYEVLSILNCSIILIAYTLCFFKISLTFLKKLFLAEFFIWILKLLFIKGGYAIGIGAPMHLIIEYDTMSLFLRLLIIGVLIFINKRKKYYTVIPTIVVAYLLSHYIIMLKLYYLAKPFYIN